MPQARNRWNAFLAFLLVLSLPSILPAQSAAPPKGDAKGERQPEAKADSKIPVDRVSTTRHSLNLSGQPLAYTANAGTLVLKAEDGTPRASIFYVAYTKDGVKDPATRPLTFSFNGGPGAAAVWVHLGAFGPKIVARDDEGMGFPPPGRLVDNESSILDLTDLVFLDPVSTGFSRAAPGQDPKQFHGVDEDIDAVAEFIRLWTTRNQRWASPKFVAGESYGTTRAAGLAEHLESRYGMALNGVILLSSVLNWQNQEFHVGNDMPFIIHVPTYAATAWYHKRAPKDFSGDLQSYLREAEEFARGEYADALMQGDRLSVERRRAVAAKLARYTGLSVDYVERSNLRIEIFRFLKELLRGEGKTVGRLDSRFTGSDLDGVGEVPEFDPASASIDASYNGLMQDYLRRDLGFEEDRVYERLSRAVHPWGWKGYENQYVNMAEPLRQAMTRNRDLRVFIASGVYDFATPYFDALYTVDHLGLPEELRGHIKVELYEAGHMMYIRKADHRKLKRDLAAFYAEAAR